MGRLIDAEAFEEFVHKNCKDGLADMWCELIRRQPTAYDLEGTIKKITELQLKTKDKELAADDEEFATMLRGKLRGIADCLETVKSGITSTDGKNGG